VSEPLVIVGNAMAAARLVDELTGCALSRNAIAMIGRDAGAVIPTYCNDTVMRMPTQGNSAMDRQLMRETGRQLADGHLKDPPLLVSDTISELGANDGLPSCPA
jgi:hypothetical protein